MDLGLLGAEEEQAMQDTNYALVVALVAVSVSSRGTIISVPAGLILIVTLVLAEQAGDLVLDFLAGRF